MSAQAQMRVAVLEGPRRVAVRTLPVPEAGPNQVRIRLEGSGLCGSNLPTWQGREWMRYPLPPGAPGHEGWGVIDQIGEGVAGLKEGDRVATLSGSAFAERQVIPSPDLVRLPPALNGQPFPGEPLGCAMNIFRRSGIAEGQTVAIIGIGFLGALLTKLSKHAGANVIAITRRPFALELARRYGADECIPMDDHWRIIDRVKALTGGRLCERVIEVTGEQWPLDLAGELTQERGRLVIAGYHQDPRQVNMQLWNWRGLDVVNAHERDPRVYKEGMQLAIDAIISGKIDPTPLYTHRFSLEGLGEAFGAMEKRPDGFLKALITP